MMSPELNTSANDGEMLVKIIRKLDSMMVNLLKVDSLKMYIA